MDLNKNQISVISELSKMKEATIGKIAQKTGMHRQSAKIVVRSLLEKKLIQKKTAGNRIIYSITNLKEAKERYISSLDFAKKDIGRLKALYESTKDTQTINALPGKTGLRTMLLDEIIKKQTICAFHLASPKSEFEAEYRANDSRRQKNGINLKIISAYKVEKIPLSSVKYTKKKSNIEIFVYANKVTMFYQGNESKIFTIKINEITKFFQEMFDRKWNCKNRIE